ncbi:hypothetical protein FLX56_18610 [Synechococcus moorigangaii CMS01]|nr:hypothetical protein [Synechococcus moorigangaii CMS01]
MNEDHIADADKRGLEKLSEELSAETGEIITAEQLAQNPALLSMMEMTTGAYPPPSMLRDYKALDEELFREIVRGAVAQRDHRLEIERAEAAQSRSLRRWGQISQFGLGFFALAIAALMKAVPAFYGIDTGWAVPVAIAVLGVGGLPAATIMARVFTGRRDN